MTHARREMAQQVILSYADDAKRANKMHVVRSELMMAEAAISGEIDDGQTMQQLVKEWQ